MSQGFIRQWMIIQKCPKADCSGHNSYLPSAGGAGRGHAQAEMNCLNLKIVLIERCDSVDALTLGMKREPLLIHGHRNAQPDGFRRQADALAACLHL